MTGRVLIRISALAAVLLVAFAAPAAAQVTPPTDAYGGKQSEVLGNFQTGGEGEDIVPPPAPAGTVPSVRSAPTTRPVERGVDAPVTPAVARGQLPFTGFETGLVVLAGLALLGTGIAMRRASRNAA